MFEAKRTRRAEPLRTKPSARQSHYWPWRTDAFARHFKPNRKQPAGGQGLGWKLTEGKAGIIGVSGMSDTYTIAEAQSNLPRLCRSGKRFVIARRAKPVYVALPITDYEALQETMDLLANPKARKTLAAAKAGRLTYKELDLDDEDFGL